MDIFTLARQRRAFLLAIFLLPVLLAFAGPAVAQTETPTAERPVAQLPIDERFGVIESYEDPVMAARLGVAWTRVRFQWADVQPNGPADWIPPIDDETLAAELAAGREVVGLLIGIPKWARDGRGLPRGLKLAYDDPGNSWAVFVTTVVTRYAGRIDRWIIWNEPDIGDSSAPGHTWDGDIEAFAQLQKTAYLAARDANSAAVIHLSAFTYFWDPGYFAELLDVLAADPEAAANNNYFDVATAHLYFQPNLIYNILYAFRRVLDVRGLDQPIWLVETNAPPMDDPYWKVANWTLAVTLNEQAAFIPQAIAVSLAAGVDRIAVYKLQDTPGDRQANPEPFGLIRWDNSRRPAYDAYRVAIRRMSGVEAAERERWDGVAQIQLTQDGQTTTVLFARLPWPQQAEVRATAETAELVDMWGNHETIESVDGAFTIDLPAALCTQTIADYCMIGGTTYYLIQDTAKALTGGPPVSHLPDEELLEEATATATVTTPAAQPTQTPTRQQAATAVVIAVATSTVVPEATATPTPTAVPTEPVATPAVTTPAVEPSAGQSAGDGANSYLGLAALGLGLLLAILLSGWWLAMRRRPHE